MWAHPQPPAHFKYVFFLLFILDKVLHEKALKIENICYKCVLEFHFASISGLSESKHIFL
jgi:hypothetical protein